MHHMICPFLASPRKGPKEGDLRGADARSCAQMRPLKNLPQRAFGSLPITAGQKSEHFRLRDAQIAADHRCGRGYIGGGCILRSNERLPLCPLLWLLSCRSKKVTSHSINPRSGWIGDLFIPAHAPDPFAGWSSHGHRPGNRGRFCPPGGI